MPRLAQKVTVTPASKIQSRIDALLDIQASIARLKLEEGLLRSELKTAAFAAFKRGKVCETDTHKVLYVEGEHAHVSADALLKLGVTPTLIQKATMRTPYAYPRIIDKSKPSRTPHKED